MDSSPRLRSFDGDTGPAYVLLVLTVAWLADTGGYAFGRLWGRRKLYEAVSPRKTYAGFFGSLFAAVCSGALAHFVYLRELPLVDALLLGLVGGTLGQFGDLAESLLKRSTGIKDSGPSDSGSWGDPGPSGLAAGCWRCSLCLHIVGLAARGSSGTLYGIVAPR